MSTARSLGSYDLAASLADLIDNSITARSSLIEVNFEPTSNDVVVRIRDNGNGMSRDALIAAMRPASVHPDAARDEDDLGRFGWGLKSASLSQARVLTVVSWREGKPHAARWDIDNIADWSMDFFSDSDALDLLEHPLETAAGTEVIWSRCDRLHEGGSVENVDDSLTNKIAQANRRLSLIFHCYLSGEAGKRLDIRVNGTNLKAINPFLTNHDATQTLDAELIDTPEGAKIRVQPYVLPHFSKLSIQEQQELGGAEGMVRNQGFYVYRNRRLIIHGTWFSLVPHGELSQLVRVRIDLPNSTDSSWRITVDKSGAQLPAALQRRLRQVVKQFSKRSILVHRKKGVSLNRTDRTPIWSRIAKNGRISYVVNRDHPMILRMLQAPIDQGEPESILRMIESYFPSEQFIVDAGRSDEKLSQCPSDTKEFEALLNQCMFNYMTEHEGSADVERFLLFLRNIEPFASQWAYSASYIRNHSARLWGLENGV